MNDLEQRRSLVPDASVYLQAGLPLPWLSDAEWWQIGHRYGTLDDVASEIKQPPTEHPRTITIEDPEGQPAAIVWFPSQHYLSTPPRSGWNSWRTLDRHLTPSGAPRLTVGEKLPLERRQNIHRSPPPSGRIRMVTIDTTVLDVGIDPAKFRVNDALIVSAALALDMQGSVGYSVVDENLGYYYGPGWNASTVTPLDQNVLKTYQMLLTDAKEPGPLLREGLTRTDLVCAATAYWFKAPLYTTRPELYEGLGKKVRTVEYGEIRNKKALPPEDESSAQ